MYYKAVKDSNAYQKIYYNILFWLVLISVKFKPLVILTFFLIEAECGWAKIHLGHEYLSRRTLGDISI